MLFDWNSEINIKAENEIVEFEDDHLVFSNYGTFIPNSVEDVVLRDTPEENYPMF